MGEKKEQQRRNQRGKDDTGRWEWDEKDADAGVKMEREKRCRSEQSKKGMGRRRGDCDLIEEEKKDERMPSVRPSHCFLPVSADAGVFSPWCV